MTYYYESNESSNSPIDDFIESAEDTSPKEFRSRLADMLGLPVKVSDGDLSGELMRWVENGEPEEEGVASLPKKRREKNFRRAIQKLHGRSWTDPIDLPQDGAAHHGKVLEFKRPEKGDRSTE